MCGITGFAKVGTGSRALPSVAVLDRMTDAVAYRGPDSRGVWFDAAHEVGLGHRRLAIRDLSPTGAQPMTSSCQRYVIAYNGEVYSHAEIVADLDERRRNLRGHSDTEVMLEACAEWGVDRLVPRLIGMFAFALYDKEKRELVLVRDRLGIKPLYWSLIDGVFMFASELKSMRQVPDWTPRLDRNAVSAFMRHNYIPAPHTIYQDVYKLEPGCRLRIDRHGTIRIDRYWNLRTIAEAGARAPRDLTDAAALDGLDQLLSDAVRRRLVADVPVGALLSGGVDSSLVAALMAEQVGSGINTYCIGFAEKGFDEAPYARAIARHLGTHHTELYAKAADALEMIDKLPHWYDEPFADSSQLPTALVCALTRRNVTVALSGDGGDELFAGYQRYAIALDMWRKPGAAPKPIRNLLARGLQAIPSNVLDTLGTRMPAPLRKSDLASKVQHYADAMLDDDPDILYRRMLSHWHEPDALVIGAHEPKGILWDADLRRALPDFLDRMMLLDTLTYLPDDILTKVDRASMVVALEARVPLLDHRVVEYAWSLPQRMKTRGGITKWALREVLYRRVPRALIERPKMGFGVPLADWLRGPLRDWAEALLDRSRLAQQGLLRPEPIHERWQAHLGGANWAYPLWNVLMLQAWLKANPEVAL